MIKTFHFLSLAIIMSGTNICKKVVTYNLPHWHAHGQDTNS